jgi:hypothetical protein
MGKSTTMSVNPLFLRCQQTVSLQPFKVSDCRIQLAMESCVERLCPLNLLPGHTQFAEH